MKRRKISGREKRRVKPSGVVAGKKKRKREPKEKEK